MYVMFYKNTNKVHSVSDDFKLVDMLDKTYIDVIKLKKKDKYMFDKIVKHDDYVLDNELITGVNIVASTEEYYLYMNMVEEEAIKIHRCINTLVELLFIMQDSEIRNSIKDTMIETNIYKTVGYWGDGDDMDISDFDYIISDQNKLMSKYLMEERSYYAE